MIAMDEFFGDRKIIISLDVDRLLNERLKSVAHAGFFTVEINSRDPKILAEILQNFPSLCVGASNIINAQQLEDCLSAGVHFASSPGFLPTIAQTATIYSMCYLPGIATLSEAMQVMALGYSQVRPYPTKLSFCALLNKCFPTLRLFPVEIEWDEVEHYLNLPAVAAVSILNPQSKDLRFASSQFEVLGA